MSLACDVTHMLIRLRVVLKISLNTICVFTLTHTRSKPVHVIYIYIRTKTYLHIIIKYIVQPCLFELMYHLNLELNLENRRYQLLGIKHCGTHDLYIAQLIYARRDTYML